MKTQLLLIVISVALFSGCSSMSAPQMAVSNPEMVYEPTGNTVRVVSSLNTDIPGNFFKMEEFEAALRLSISNSNLYKINSQSFDYLIRAKIVDFKTTGFGLDMETFLEVLYVITDSETNEELDTERVGVSYTASVKDAFVGYTRSIMSVEGACKRNISNYVIKLSEKNL